MGQYCIRGPRGDEIVGIGSIRETRGNTVSGVKIDLWEGDPKGSYGVQNPSRTRPDGRGVLHSDADGLFCITAIAPIPYPIRMDGPVKKMLRALVRHPNRPRHVHFMMEKLRYDLLVT